MTRVLITGMSGVGKSALLDELARRGHRTVDTDYGDFYEEVDGERLWRTDRIEALLQTIPDGSEDLLFIQGTTRNQRAFYPQFDHIVLLSTPTDELIRRLKTRTTNPYGKDPAELAETLGYVESVEPLLRASATLEVVTTVPVPQVADIVLARVQRPRPARPGMIGAMTSASPFGQVDSESDEMQRMMVGYLDRAGSHQEMQRVRTLAFDLFAPAPGERLLDAGCGTGEVARQLASRVGRQGAVTAIDHSAFMVDVAKSRDVSGSVEYRTGDINSLEFPDAHFDGVHTERVIQHLADPEAAIKELIRVTRPGGRVCVVDTDWSSLVSDGFDYLSEVTEQLALWRLPDTARRVRSRMVKAGLVSTTAYPLTLRFTSPEDASGVIPVTNSFVLQKRITPELYERSIASVEQSAERGDFLLAFTMWISIGRVPVA